MYGESFLSMAHREWHYVHGQVVCPLDCGIGETGCPGCGDVDCDGTCHPDVHGSA